MLGPQVQANVSSRPRLECFLIPPAQLASPIFLYLILFHFTLAHVIFTLATRRLEFRSPLDESPQDASRTWGCTRDRATT
ncbi:hypothetical protein BOTBODRAFT_443620 [Botryobasidium botryosum FD-172 SS1]|uniref:Uncharacterized protein n=1 Tax=Botryobasidium botryosum (strain FD-172 SS1) TaxID=930990 RepID=A0A067MVF1_BOTB1|nr:hypothetical protein BOTBODRAFT_443620 [Botryobasidium botryosum FD-172 SS1]